MLIFASLSRFRDRDDIGQLRMPRNPLVRQPPFLRRADLLTACIPYVAALAGRWMEGSRVEGGARGWLSWFGPFQKLHADRAVVLTLHGVSGLRRQPASPSPRVREPRHGDAIDSDLVECVPNGSSSNSACGVMFDDGDHKISADSSFFTNWSVMSSSSGTDLAEAALEDDGGTFDRGLCSRRVGP